MTLNKGNAARTLVEQADDLGPIFKLLHQKLPMRTMIHILPEDSPLKKMLFEAFDTGELASILNLASTKRDTIVDFIMCYLEVMTEIASAHNVQAGFIENGALDPTHQRMPTLNGILATCKRNISVEEQQNIIDNFDEIFQSFEKNGCMPESVHDAVGIANDLDPHGQVVRREADANREHLQRCKCMNHPQVITERNELQSKSNNKQLESMQKANAKFMEKVLAYNNSIQKIKTVLRADGLGSKLGMERDESIIEKCTLEHLGKLNVDSLKAFIFGRSPISGKVPNKGTVDGAKEGDRNLIQLAFECRNMPNKQYSAHVSTISLHFNLSPHHAIHSGSTSLPTNQRHHCHSGRRSKSPPVSGSREQSMAPSCPEISLSWRPNQRPCIAHARRKRSSRFARPSFAPSL